MNLNYLQILNDNFLKYYPKLRQILAKYSISSVEFRKHGQNY
jgi:hypothetical protein